MDSQLLFERREERPTGRLPTFDASMRTAADHDKMKPRRHAAALKLLVLAISMAGCGSSNNSSSPCSKTTAGLHDRQTQTINSAAVGRFALPDSPYAPRQ